MEYQSFGRSGLKSSRVCFGGMLLSSNGRGPWRMPAVSDVATSEAMLDKYVKAGGNFIDTSNNYGESEAIIGNWLKKQSMHTRRKLIIASKFTSPVDTIPANAAINYPNSSGSSRKHIMDAIEDTLQRLQTNYLDIYTIHFWDDGTQLEDIIRTLHCLIEMGRIRYYAVSNYTPLQLQQLISLCKHHRWDLPVFIQCQYNLLCRTAEWELIHLCQSHGIGFLAWSPLAGGWLSNKYSGQNKTQMTKPPANSRMSFAEAVHFSSWDLSNMANNPRTWSVLRVCNEISIELKCTVSQVAIKWILLNQGVTGCIIGPRTFNHLEDSLAALKLEFTPKHMAMLDEASKAPPIYPYCAFSQLTVKPSSTLATIDSDKIDSTTCSTLCGNPVLQRLIDFSSSFQPTKNREAWLTRLIDQNVYELAANINAPYVTGLPSTRNDTDESSCSGDTLKIGLVFGGFVSYEEPVTMLRQHLLQLKSNRAIRTFIYDALELIDQHILYVKKELGVTWMDTNLNLFEWIRSGAYGSKAYDRPNFVLFTPLFYINQFVSFMRFLELSNLTLTQLKHHCIFSSGFSLGLVPAYVIHISDNEEQLRHNALAAIRLFFWGSFRTVQAFRQLNILEYSKQMDDTETKSSLSKETIDWILKNDISGSIQIVGVPYEEVHNAIEHFNNTNEFNCKFDACVVLQNDCVTIFGLPPHLPHLIQYLQTKFPACSLFSVPLDVAMHTPRYFVNTLKLTVSDYFNGQPQFRGISSKNKWNQTAFISCCDGKPTVAMTPADLAEAILTSICRWDLVSDSLAHIIQSSDANDPRAPIILLDFGPAARSKNLISNNIFLQQCLAKKQITLYTMTKLPQNLLVAAQKVYEITLNLKTSIGKSISTHNDHLRSSIAIVGMACRFPDANNPDEYFYNLLNKKNSIKTIPKERWNHSKYYDPHSKTFYKTKAQHMGTLDDIDLFDPQFFNLSTRDANRMDPQQRLTLEMCYLALENAGYVIADGSRIGFDEQRVGVFVGCTGTDGYSKNIEAHMDAPAVQCRPRSMQAGRVSYFFKFCGPSLQVDTACSTSLVCLHLAVESLLRGECDAAVICAALTCIDPLEYIGLAGSGFLSTGPNGGCQSFSADADGYTRSDGIAAIIIKPYRAALKDRDAIHALINSTAINQSGQSQSLLLPSQPQIESLMDDALTKARIPPSAIHYVEAHGTGTQGGDPIEMNAIIKSLGMDIYRSDKNPLYVGSHKAFIGHCEAAAGLAGIIKTVLLLQHKTITPHIHIDKIHPNIEMQRHVIIPQQAISWTVPHSLIPRRAIVNSFGFNGSNASCVLQESPTIQQNDDNHTESIESAHLITISAKHPDSVKAYCLRFIQYLLAMGQKFHSFSYTPEVSDTMNESRFLRDLAYTTTARRNHFMHRLAIVTSSIKDLIQSLTLVVASIPGQLERLKKMMATAPFEDLLRPHNQHLFLSKDLHNSVHNTTHASISPTNRIVFMFGGQGSQYFGMCYQLLNSDNMWATTFRHCSELFAIIHPNLLPNHMTLIQILVTAHEQKLQQTDKTNTQPILDEQTFNSTLVSQPLLFAIEYSFAKMLMSWDIHPSYIIGHSLGELVGACVSSVMSLEDALYLIGHRARLMRNTSDGAMLAINCTLQDFTNLCHILHLNEDNRIDVSLAANNATHSILIGGDMAAIDALHTYITNGQLFHATKLRVNHAFHTHLMTPILSEFKSFTDRIVYKKATIPIFSTLDGKLRSTFDSEYWIEQLRQPVQFHAATSTLHSLAIEEKFTAICIELNPTPVLTQHMSEARHELQTHYIMHRNRDDFQQIYSVIAHLYVHQQLPISWSELHRHNRHARVLSLPNYVFNQKSCWLKLPYVIETDQQDNTSNFQNHSTTTSHVHHPLSNGCTSNIQEIPFIGKCHLVENKSKNTFECRFPLFDRLWRVDIQNHTVASKALCPVALYVALTSQFTSFIMEQIGIKSDLHTLVTVKDFMMKTPLFWEEKDSKAETCRQMIISLVLTKTDATNATSHHTFTFTLASQQQSVPSIIHAFGKISLTNTYSHDIDQDKTTFKRIIASMVNDKQNQSTHLSCDRSEFYRKSDEVAVSYGSHYRLIDKFVIDNQALASWAMQIMNVKQPYSDSNGHTLIHPSWLDSFMQAGAVQFSHIPNLNRPLIAMFIENLICRTHLYNSSSPSTAVTLTRQNEDASPQTNQSEFPIYYTESRAIMNNTNQITFEVRGFDTHGQCVVHLTGGIMRTASVEFMNQYESSKIPEQDHQPDSIHDHGSTKSNGHHCIKTTSPNPRRIHIHKRTVETLPPPLLNGMSEHPSRQIWSYEEVRNQLTALIVESLESDTSVINEDEHLAQMGVDSLMSIEIRGKIQTYFGLDLPASLIFDHPTIKQLAELIQNELVLQKTRDQDHFDQNGDSYLIENSID